MPPSVNPRDPWRRAPVGELQEQLLPRWFVLTALILVPVAIVAAIAAFLVFGPDEVPVAQRRPPPGGGLTSDVGDYRVGNLEPQPYAEACPALQGVRIAGTDDDLAALRLGIAGLCNTSLEPGTEDAIRAFARDGGVVRFAQFEATGVDSAAVLDGEPSTILVNARLQRTDPLWIAPVVAHDAVVLSGDAETVDTRLAARRAEAQVCERLLSGRRPSRGCDDAQQLLAQPDPAAALRDAGFE